MAASNSSLTNGIPKGTARTESGILDILKACKARNFGTLADVALSGVKGEPLDDKTYLMERVIQLVSDLPLHDKMSDTLTNKFLSELWSDLEHPPQSYLGYDYVFRQANGANNNIVSPHIGQAGQPYARSVRPKRMQPARPDPGVVYDSLLKRKAFKPHPNKISSVLFYVASIIIHDCFHTSHKDYAISETSSYLDLAPLYGNNEAEQKSVRTLKDGKLKPDCFADSRILGFPPGVGVLLIMFNRFHNQVVENLAKIDEGQRFSGILSDQRQRRTGLTPGDKQGQPPKKPLELYDEALFQTGRLITTGLYINIVLGDYVRTILGLNRVDSLWNLDPRAPYNKGLFGQKIPEAGGNQVSAEFSLVYRWHSCVSQRDEKWTDTFLEQLAQKSKDPKMSTIQAAAMWADEMAKTVPDKRPFENLERQADGSYSDDVLCKIWVDSVDDVAGAFGASHVPENLKFVEVLSMIQSRSWNLASLNEFREYFKLQPHKTFESINPDPYIAGQLKKLYGHPDNVEIYPGIVVESAKKPMDPGSGLCASWTTSRAILSDAVALVRGDRFYTIDYTPNNLTNWGFNTANYDLNVNHGGVFYKLVLNAFPNHITKNSVYAHFPLVNPPENEMLLGRIGRAQLYNFKAPAFRPTVNIEAKATLGSKALTDSVAFTSLWNTRSAAFGAPEAATKAAPAPPKLTFAEAVLANENWKTIATKFYTTTLTKLWKEEQYELGGYQQIDIVADVLNKAHVAFVTSVLGIPLTEEGKDHKEHHHDGILENLGCIFETAFAVDAQPKGLGSTVRKWTGWIANHIATAFESTETHTKEEGDLGRAAFQKLIAANGSSAAAKKLIWQDILPTSALILTTLSRATASATEQVITADENPTLIPTMSIAVRATTDATDGVSQKGELVIVDISTTKSHSDVKKLGADVVLAQQVADVANKALLAIVKGTSGISRVPGPQGKIKTIQFEGQDVKYLNDVESDYVAYPTSMKVRWKK